MTKVIGLTGPTGAGKSTAAGIFRSLGAEIIDCDRLAGDVLTMPECIDALKKTFGDDIAPRGSVNRSLLAERAFRSPEDTEKLNEITHPAIIHEMERRISAGKEAGVPIILVDGALLFESGVYRSFDATIAILAERELRLRRIMERDGIDRKQAEERAGAQKNDAYYRSRAGYLLNGGEGTASLEKQVKALFLRILEE